MTAFCRIATGRRGRLRSNEEYHDFIDGLSDRKFYGEITLYFQGGNIESSRTSERVTKSEMRDKMLSRKSRKVTVSRLLGNGNG
jgi:hypothetical protein